MRDRDQSLSPRNRPPATANGLEHLFRDRRAPLDAVRRADKLSVAAAADPDEGLFDKDDLASGVGLRNQHLAVGAFDLAGGDWLIDTHFAYPPRD